MATLEYIQRDINLFVDATDYAGSVEQIRLPVLKEKSESHQGGGADFESMMRYGYDALTAEFQIVDLDPSVIVQAGRRYGNDLPLTAYGYLQGERDTRTNAVAYLRGRITELDFATWEPSKKVPLKWTMAINVYRLTIGQAQMFNIDVRNRIFEVAGVDQTVDKRRLLGSA